MDRLRKTRVVGGLLVVTLAAADAPQLPEAAEKAVERLFPSATIVAVGHEREAGVAFYEVRVRDGSALREIEVTADGAVGEVEGVVAMGDVPPAALDAIARATRGAAVRSVERHEVHGVARDGTFIALDPPSVVYEVVYESGGRVREVAVTANGARIANEDEDSDDDEPDDDD